MFFPALILLRLWCLNHVPNHLEKKTCHAYILGQDLYKNCVRFFHIPGYQNESEPECLQNHHVEMKLSNKKRVAMHYISGKSMKASRRLLTPALPGENLQTESTKHWYGWIWPMALRFIFSPTTKQKELAVKKIQNGSWEADTMRVQNAGQWMVHKLKWRFINHNKMYDLEIQH